MSVTALHVCGIAEVPRFAGLGITDIVSIGAKGTMPDVRAFHPQPSIHRFEFDDICHVAKPGEKDISPTLEDVRGIIAVADQLLTRAQEVRVLYHCQGGISRSTASAFIFCVRAGMTYEAAYHYILSVRGALAPNVLMIKYADHLMGHGGKMLDYIASHRPDAQEWVRKNGWAVEEASK